MQKCVMSEKNILREEEQEGELRMRFEDPFFGQWIRAPQPPWELSADQVRDPAAIGRSEALQCYVCLD